MKAYFLLPLSLVISSCAGSASQNDYYNSLSYKMLQAGRILNAQSSPPLTCSSLDIRPIASPGCRYVCINGQWAEVC